MNLRTRHDSLITIVPSLFNPKIQLVLLDFDGTLVDTAPDLVRASNRYLQQKGLEPIAEARIRAEIGMGLKNLIVELFPEDQRSPEQQKIIEQEFLQVYEKEFLETPRLFDGAYEFLTEFPGQIGIVSNKRERFIRPILEKLGVDHLPWVDIVGGDTLDHMKPHPAPFLRVIEAAGVTPEETVIVGDGTPDIEGAKAIGSRAIAVEFGYTPLEDLMAQGAWASITDYGELRPLIESIT